MKKFFAVLAAACLVLSTAGCQQNDVSADQNGTETIEIKTIEPPENGWTLDTLNEVLYLNGQQIQLPLMFNTLKDGYEIRDKIYNDTSNFDNDVVGGYLYYENNLIAMVAFNELENDIEILSIAFFRDDYKDNQDVSKYISINGFGLQSDINDIYSCLGNEYINESELLVYDIKGSNFIITIPNISDFGISLRYLDKEKYDILIGGDNQNN